MGLVIAILGFNYYMGKKTEERRLETEAQIQAQKQAQAQAIEQKKQAKLEKDIKAEIDKMPVEARQFLLSRYPDGEKQDFSPQPQDSQDRKKLKAVVEVWGDNVQLAGQTSRIALSNIVSKLQDDKRKLEQIQTTPCITFAQAYLYASMDSTIEGFLAFMGENNSMSTFHTEQASKHLQMFNKKIDECK